MKKIFSTAIAAFVLIFAFFAFSSSAFKDETSGQCGENIFWTYDESTQALILTGSGDMYNLSSSQADTSKSALFYHVKGTVKSIVVSDGITSIGDYAFYNFSNAESAVISKDVASIGNYAFFNCINLSDLSFGTNITSIGDNAFASCSKAVNLPLGKNVKAIGDYAFQGCGKLTSVEINKDTVYGKYVFSMCSGLTSVTFEEGLTQTTEGMFHSCSKLNNVVLPESMKIISKSTFGDCRSLSNITISQSVTTIEDSAFTLCALETVKIRKDVQYGKNVYAYSKVKEVEFEKGVTSVCESEFKGCTSLEKAQGKDITSIADMAFSGCSKLKTVMFGEKLEIIGKQTFLECKLLEEIPEITSGSIGEEAFFGCDALKSVQIKKDITYGKNVFYLCGGLEGVVFEQGVISTSEGMFNSCKNLSNVTYPNTIKVIARETFSDCPAFQNAEFPDSVQMVGENAFYKTGIKNVTISASVIYGKGVYEGSQLTKVIFDKGVTESGSDMFKNCKELKEVVLPNTVQKISPYSFYNCSKLEIIELPLGIIEIGDFAFTNTAISSVIIKQNIQYGFYVYSGSKVTSAEVQKGITEIPEGMFYGCSQLKSVVVPDTVTTIAAKAFCDCSSLSDINIPSSVKKIDTAAFSNTSIKSAVLRNDVEYGQNVFEKTKIFNAVIEQGVTKIPNLTFNGCEYLSYIYIPDSVLTVGARAFYNCTGLKTVIIGRNVDLISNEAFCKCSGMENLVILSKKVKFSRETFALEQNGIKNIVDYSRLLEFSVMDEFDAGVLAKRGHLYTYKDISDYEYIKKSGIKHTALKDYETSDNDHLFTDFCYKQTVTPTCTNPGKATAICITCGKEGNELIVPVYGHNFDRTLVKKASIEQDGEFLDICKLCGFSEKVVIPKIASVTIIRKAESDTTGSAEVKDSAGNPVVKTYSVLYSKNTKVGEATATITFTGNYEGKTECKFIIKPDKLTSFTAETYKSDSIEVNFKKSTLAKDCNVAIYISKDKTNWEKVASVAETQYIIEGLDVASHYYLKAQIESEYGNGPETEKTAHTSLLKGEPIKVTRHCGAMTVEVYKCNVCGVESIKSYWPAEGPSEHSYDADKPAKTVKTTCTTKGYKLYYCSVCSEPIYIYDETVVLHHFEDYSVLKAPTCKAKGFKEVKCVTCTYKKTEEIPKISCKAMKVPALAATCTEDGRKAGICCEMCNKVMSGMEIIPKTGHTIVTDKAVAATCTKAGKTKGYHCKTCGDVIEIQKPIKALGHKYDKTVTTKAKTDKNGSIVKECSRCGEKSTTVIYCPKTYTVSNAVYSGKALTPKVTIKDSKGNVISSSNYTVSYSSNTAIGTATVKVTFKGNYSGTKNVNFKIVPGQVTGLKATTVTTSSVKLAWTKVNGAKYYKVEQSADGKTWKTIATTDKTTYTVSKLSAGSKLQFRVTALDGTKKIAGKASAVLKTGTKTAAPSVTLKSSKSKTATASWSKIKGAKKYVVYKSTDNKNWTKAGETTKLTFDLSKLTAGKKIYVKVVAVNEYNQSSANSKIVSVTVK